MGSYYSRLFGGPFAGHDETHLRELSARMKDIPQNRRGRPRRGDLAPSGFVYLGQFLDHDLTRDETKLEHASTDPERTKNLNAPRLNLESLYGGGPKKSPDLYDLSESGSETFLLGNTKALPQKRIPSTPDDFCRRNGRPLLADHRNDQHLILAQLHVVFLQVHNRVMDYLKRGAFADEPFPNETIIETASPCCLALPMDRPQRILEVVCFAGDFDGHRTERAAIFQAGSGRRNSGASD